MRRLTRKKTDSAPKCNVWFLILLIGAGLWAIKGSYQEYYKTNALLAVALKAEGKITDIHHRKKARRRRDTYTLIYAYEHPSHGNIHVKDMMGTSSPDYEIGDAVEVLYDPKNPNNARISDWTSIWGAALLRFVIGAMCAGGGVYGLFFKCKRL